VVSFTVAPIVQASVVVSPCVACKILHRRCVKKCILAPYFPSSKPLKFTIAHRIFHTSNIIKLLLKTSLEETRVGLELELPKEEWVPINHLLPTFYKRHVRRR
ncbi:hypothetical protein Csa_023609, partial [Cucumis sativus]